MAGRLPAASESPRPGFRPRAEPAGPRAGSGATAAGTHRLPAATSLPARPVARPAPPEPLPLAAARTAPVRPARSSAATAHVPASASARQWSCPGALVSRASDGGRPRAGRTAQEQGLRRERPQRTACSSTEARSNVTRAPRRQRPHDQGPRGHGRGAARRPRSPDRRGAENATDPSTRHEGRPDQARSVNSSANTWDSGCGPTYCWQLHWPASYRSGFFCSSQAVGTSTRSWHRPCLSCLAR